MKPLSPAEHDRLIEDFIQHRGVTKCPRGYAYGAAPSDFEEIRVESYCTGDGDIPVTPVTVRAEGSRMGFPAAMCVERAHLEALIKLGRVPKLSS